MTLFSDPAVVEAATKALTGSSALDYSAATCAKRVLAAAVAALPREALIEKATAHFERADDHLSSVRWGCWWIWD